MFERFSHQARAVVMRAADESRGLRHGHVGTEHLLLALLSPVAGGASTVLRAAGVDPARVRADVERLGGTSREVLGDLDAAALRDVGIDLDAVLARMEERFGPDALRPPAPERRRRVLGRRRGGRGRFTPRARKVLELSLRESLRLRSDRIGSEHILLGLLREGHGRAITILRDADVDLDRLRSATLRMLDEAA